MKKKVLSIFRNFALIKLFFALLTSYLLYEEFITFWIEKPTYTSSSKVKIAPMDFPDITICPFPSWNQQELLKLGYSQSFEYSKAQFRFKRPLSVYKLFLNLCSECWNHNRQCHPTPRTVKRGRRNLPGS